MEKEEILRKAKKENKKGDERTRSIETISSEVSYIAVITTLGILAMECAVQTTKTGTSFADINIFILLFMVAIFTKYITLYYYYKKKRFLIVSLFSITGTIISLVNVVMTIKSM